MSEVPMSVGSEKGNPQAPITITEAAAEAIARRGEREGCEGQALRVQVKGGGCSGATYAMSYEADGPRDGDYVTTQHGATVFIDPRSIVFLKNSTLDFKSELMSQRFVWTNPQAKGTCGCGESFSL
jgi:iron-sulfur cluster assembly accessory protein